MREVNVISFFDGISCGYEAFERAGFKIGKYYAYEIEVNSDPRKSNCLTTVSKDNIVVNPHARANKIVYLSKPALNYMAGLDHGVPGRTRMDVRSNKLHTKAKCLTASGAKGVPHNVIDLDNGMYRYYTVTEMERLQTLRDGYTEVMPKSHAIKALGNGWNVETIAHILSYDLHADLL